MIQKTIISKPPSQLKLTYALWTRKAVMGLIENQMGAKLAIRTAGTYFFQRGLPPKKLLKNACE